MNAAPFAEGPSLLRINKALAEAGVCSRRAADELVRSGRVRVNGRIVDTPGFQVCPGDRLEVDGTILDRNLRPEPCCLMLHKPAGVVSTAKDPQGRTTVLDLVPPPWNNRRLYPAGRLDFFSEGLLLITDDGELTHRLIHPSRHLARVYHVLVREAVPPSVLKLFAGGMTLAEGEHLAPVPTRVLSAAERKTRRPGGNPAPDAPGRGIWLEMTLHQGLNRQIRRMCRDAGLTILRLVRVAQGPLRLGDLPSGRVRPLASEELRALHAAAGLSRKGAATTAPKPPHVRRP